jgi:hypothetical protein
VLTPRYAFSARTAAARSSVAATSLVRTVAYCVPTLVSAGQGQGFALVLALFLGALDGWFRLRVVRTARSLVAETDALAISSGFASTHIAWSSVLAVEVWHRLNRVDYVALHYRAPNGNSVATCWEQGSREELLLFVRHCAELAQVAGPRRTVAFANLSDRGVFAPLLRRLSVDLAMALFAGVLCGISGRAIGLGAAAGFLSTAMAAAPYRYRKELVRSDDGVWRRRGKNGELAPLRVIPRSVGLWIRALSEPSSRCTGGSGAANARGPV